MTLIHKLICHNKRSGLSIASLVTGIISIVPFGAGVALGIAGIVCGAIDLNRIKEDKSSKKGRGFDIAGIILGAVGIVVSIVLYIVIIVSVIPWGLTTFGY